MHGQPRCRLSSRFARAARHTFAQVHSNHCSSKREVLSESVVRPLVGSRADGAQWLPLEGKNACPTASVLPKANTLKMDFAQVDAGTHLGWMFNMEAITTVPEGRREEHSAATFYFVRQDGAGFRCCFLYAPYFYVHVKAEAQREVEALLMRKYDAVLGSIESVMREDLDLPNHLSGAKKSFLKLTFRNEQDMGVVRKEMRQLVQKNKKREAQTEAYTSLQPAERVSRNVLESLQYITEMREHDVPYLQRVCIDNGFRAGLWYDVSITDGLTRVQHRPDLIERPDVRTLAFDIETTKSPLKFPNSSKDSVMMISYMVDGDGYLIINRDIVAEDIDDFEYSPKPQFPGNFQVFNMPNEEQTLRRFFEHIRELKPVIYVTYNGDFFDWPFIETRSEVYGLSLKEEIGIWREKDEFKGNFSVHLDAFSWVRRDSYLPQGSQGLKAVTRAKLNYDPLELDPELMVPYAYSQPQILASYSVSDAVATYYLYMKYVHSFIFSLSTIIPMTPGDVLRKGSGTLCEMLLMVKAYENDIMAPNKKGREFPIFYKNQLLDSETYIGGHVEGLESGVFREDFTYKFNVEAAAFKELAADVRETVSFAVTNEWGRSIDEVTNLDEVCSAIEAQLEELASQSPVMECHPLIYHLDVGAMYPNIILTNRLQPMAIVDKKTCAACDHNVDSDQCQRHMSWVWRGKYYPVTRSEFAFNRSQVEAEQAGKWTPDTTDMILKRVKEYSQKVYRKTLIEQSEERKAVVCQRENSFYVDTVRNFRDRRYEFKALKKKWFKEAKKATDPVELLKAENMELLYDSLQLAHKCILNSFYGYVMRRGARWHSMEMAGVVTATGANIIKDARILVERIGTPLELDTDGIWCMLPGIFPEEFELHSSSGSFTMSYPGTVLNLIVNRRYTNDQYQTLHEKDGHRSYSSSSVNTIFFEVDGPYKSMVLPAAQQEGKSLKKRYAVYNRNGTLAELKGFEIKRRGELKLIKFFQTQVFPAFLEGSDLQSCYDAVGAIANTWIDILETKGQQLDDGELFDLITESRVMSQSLKEYGNSRSTSITAAKRLGEFLGEEMVQDKGLCCTYFIAKYPLGTSVSERAIPTTIFSADPAILLQYMRKWCRRSDMNYFCNEDGAVDVRQVIDWDYYMTRLGNAIQKIITIPAAFQHIANPVPRVPHPDWLLKKVRERHGKQTQSKLGSFFSSTDKQEMLASIQRPHVEEVSKRKEPEESRIRLQDDFDGWHRQQKTYWRSLCRKNQATASTKQTRRRSGTDTLHILQATQEHSKQGQFRLWYVTEAGIMSSASIAVPRTVYLHTSKDVDPAPFGQLVSRTLPHLTETEQVVEWSMDEAVFQLKRESGELADLGFQQGVLGVYESQVPLELQLLVHMRNVCTAPIGTLPSLNSLKPANTSYLGNVAYKRLFLHVRWNGSNRSPRAVAVLLKEISNEVFIVRVGQQRNAPYPKTVCDMAATAASANSMQEAFRLLHNELQRIRILHADEPILLLNQTDLRAQSQHASDFGRLFPVFQVPLCDEPFPALNWAADIIGSVPNQWAQAQEALQHALQLAAYTGIPLGNLKQDTPSFALDVLYARQLREAQHLLWASPRPDPDLGPCSSPASRLFVPEKQNPEVCVPSIYRSPCFVLSLDNLAANTLLLYNVLESVEGSNSVNQEVVLAFRVLRQLVQGLFQDVVRKESVAADTVLQHLYRWLANTAALLHDPDLEELVHNVMTKVFYRLCAEFKANGASVVYASFTRFIISANRPRQHTASRHIDFLLDSVLENDLFAYLSMQKETVWGALLFMDAANYQGVVPGDPPRVSGYWNLASFLPSSLQSHLIAFFVDFLLQPYAFQQELMRSNEGLEWEGMQAPMAEHVTEEVDTYFTRRLLQLAQWVQLEVTEDFPRQPGSHLPLSDPALELVKMVCHVLGLDPQSSDAVARMRKTAMKLLKTPPFAEEAQYKDPCLPLVLTDVICANCNYSRDLDLCRDQALLDRDWSCVACQHQYPLTAIENALVALLKKRTTSYQVQDLVCRGCRKNQTLNLNSYCPCSGEFKLSSSSVQLGLFSSIAEYYRFDTLAEMVRLLDQ